jgi:tRNA-intron endonuclease, archaea type
MNRKLKVKEKNSQKEERGKKRIVESFFSKDVVFTECSDEARQFYEKSRFGTILEDKRVQLTLIEAYYLLEKEKIRIFSFNNSKKQIEKSFFLKKCMKAEKNFWTRFAVYSDFRNRGYIIKTALKFGADFRVYDKGVAPGEDHARWIVYPVKETEVLTWYEFAAKNRVAHSTKKRLLLGIVDEENTVTYYEIKWTRP